MKRETRFIATTGEYSDYYIVGSFKALEDFDLSEINKKYLTENPDQKGRYNFNDDKFIAFLIKNKYIEETKMIELHLGDYGTMELELSDL
jgi:hypothetical protein